MRGTVSIHTYIYTHTLSTVYAYVQIHKPKKSPKTKKESIHTYIYTFTLSTVYAKVKSYKPIHSYKHTHTNTHMYQIN